MNKFCTKCGHEFGAHAGAAYCGECGAPTHPVPKERESVPRYPGDERNYCQCGRPKLHDAMSCEACWKRDEPWGSR